MVISCTRRIEFDAGHRVVGHKNKCKFLHGHRYVLEVTAETRQLDEMGMVADFGDLKLKVKEWLDNNFDHSLILWDKDRDLGDKVGSITGQTIYYLKNNPTAENIALHLKEEILPKLFIDENYKISKIKLYETPNCFVEV